MKSIFSKAFKAFMLKPNSCHSFAPHLRTNAKVLTWPIRTFNICCLHEPEPPLCSPAPSHILVHPHYLSGMASPYFRSFTHYGRTTLASGFCSSNTQAGLADPPVRKLLPLQSHGSFSCLCWTLFKPPRLRQAFSDHPV